MDLEGHLQTWPSIAQHFEAGTLERGLPQLDAGPCAARSRFADPGL